MQRWIPAAFIRGGSSKGVFFHERDLPADRETRDRIFLAVLGSPDPYGRQLDGMGGGISSLSKAVIIAPPTHPDADVDYTFIQVAVDRPVADYSGNCGNLSSAVGPFAVEEGLMVFPDGEALVRIHNTNTRKIIHARFMVKDGSAMIEGDTAIAGVAGSGSPIRMDYLSPGGSATSGVLPSGSVRDMIDLGAGGRFEVSLIDATNPVVYVAATALGLTGVEAPDVIEARPALMGLLDRLRRAGGVRMGLGATPGAVGLANPKIVIVSPPIAFATLDGRLVVPEEQDINLRMLSMERVHRASTLTGAMCTGVAVRIEGSIPHEAARALSGGETRVANPSGVITVSADVISEGGWEARRASVYRTARRLMQGSVGIPRRVIDGV